MFWLSEKFNQFIVYPFQSFFGIPTANNHLNREKMFFIPISQHQKYSNQIKPLLLELAKGNLNNSEIILKLKKFLNYTSILKNTFQTQFQQIKNFDQPLGQLFGKIAQFVLDQESNFEQKKLSILHQSSNHSITLNKEEILYLMSLMSLNLIPRQQYNEQKSLKSSQKRSFPFPYDFSNIFSNQQYKTKTIIQYFKQNFTNDSWKNSKEKFTIKRKFISDQIQDIIHKRKNYPMMLYDIRPNNDSIEDFTGQAKIDFSNKYIGGGALSGGLAQEEILFANHPELYTSVVFCEVMNDRQAIFFNGFRKYSKSKDYGETTKYDGQEMLTPNFSNKQQYIIAIDAFNFPMRTHLMQTKKQLINRQIMKAYVGFEGLPQGVNIATGNWGCGSFNGDIRMKFVIQWIASSLAIKNMIYCPCGNRLKIIQNQKILSELEKKSIGEVYQALIKGSQKIKNMNENILQKMRELF